MTTVHSRVAANGASARVAPPPAATPGRAPSVARRRSPGAAAVSLVVVFASIAAFTVLYSTAGHRTAVLVVTRTLQKGQLFTTAVLGQASLAVTGGVTPIPVADAPTLAGKRAAVTIPAGSLLTAADVTASVPVSAGTAVVGLSLKPGQLPAAGLVAGDQVMVVQTGAVGTPLTDLPTSGASGSPSAGRDAASGPSSGVLVPRATVFDVEQEPAAASTGVAETVSVDVSNRLAVAVSAAAAAGQVTLVLLPDGAATGAATSAATGAATGTP